MNPAIEMLDAEVLSDNWYVLRKFTYRIRRADGTWATHKREAYDRGNGATILLYDTGRRAVLLTRQFRLPTYVNGNPTGMMIEACAGLLEAENPDVRIRLELREETGYEVPEIRKVFEAYMSPGSVTEILHFYVAEYSQANRVDSGGGIDEEEIEVLELPFERALDMIAAGEIKDAKTIMLLQYAALNLFA
ncbi:MAG TPA: GDP-mannose pyrophosphatase NudK [Pseudomonadales bacterium]|nr:GDP-mannose pyrophosphatase NudK [Pseudomonadales bacterium]